MLAEALAGCRWCRDSWIGRACSSSGQPPVERATPVPKSLEASSLVICGGRWRAAPGGFEVTVLTEQADLGQKGAGWKQHPKYRVLDEESRVYLWGRHWSKLEGAAAMERVPEGWAQARIPNELRYPVTAREFAFIRTRNYQRNGVTQFTRLVELKSHD